MSLSPKNIDPMFHFIGHELYLILLLSHCTFSLFAEQNTLNGHKWLPCLTCVARVVN